jgi:hypothetical protein
MSLPFGSHRLISSCSVSESAEDVTSAFCLRMTILHNTVKSRYLELEGTEKKVRDIRVFDISEVR